MTQEISSLMDGELEAHEAGRVIRSCCASSEAAERWQEYHLIGDVLRGGKPHPTGTSAKVRAALEKEPAIVAPRRGVLESTFGRVALAAAASVATIGVVGWIGSQGGPGAPATVVAKNPAGIQPVSVQPVAATVAPQAVDMQDYLAAHRQLPSPELYRPVTNNRAAAAAAR